MPTAKEVLWQQYKAATASGNQAEAQRILSMIHSNAPQRPYPGRDQGKCAKCRKRFRKDNHRRS